MDTEMELTGGRSITIEDVNKLENYTPTDDLVTSNTYISGTFIYEDGTEVTATTDNPVTMGYTASTAEKSTNKSYNYYTTKFSGKAFYLASYCINFESRGCMFCVRLMSSGKIESYWSLFNSWDYDGICGARVMPVVSLKSNIQTSGQDESGAWNLVVE